MAARTERPLYTLASSNRLNAAALNSGIWIHTDIEHRCVRLYLGDARPPQTKDGFRWRLRFPSFFRALRARFLALMRRRIRSITSGGVPSNHIPLMAL